MRNIHTVFIVAVPVSFPSSVDEGSFFSTTSPTLAVTCLVDNRHSNRYEVVSHFRFDLNFPNSQQSYIPFYICFGHLYVFLGEVSVQVLCPFLKGKRFVHSEEKSEYPLPIFKLDFFCCSDIVVYIFWIFNKGFWENWKTTCKRIKLDWYLSSYTNINSKWIKI